MGLFETFDSSSSLERKIEELTRERDEARQDLDDLSQQASIAKQQAFSADRAKAALQESVSVLRKSRQQVDDKLNLARADLGRAKQLLAIRDATIVEQELTLAELKAALSSRQLEIEQLRDERVHDPINDAVLLLGYQRQREVIDALVSTLSCPICFEPLGSRSNVISLHCGHSFCANCCHQWADRAAQTTGALECPECRQDARKAGALKVYMLEEACRVIARLDLSDLIAPPAAADTSLSASPPDEDAARILRPRTPSRYAGLSSATDSC